MHTTYCVKNAGRTSHKVGAFFYKKFIIFFTAAVFLYGCVNIPSTNKQQAIERFYFWGDESSVFQPCYSRQIYWLSGSKKKLDTMKNYYKQQKTEKKHSGIYAFLIVENSGHQSGYQSVTYDETLKLKEILSMDDSDNHPDCLPFRIPETINNR
ncbi:TPA: hypothetical protein J1248_000330 [Escherichia coli]|nr:hypothetical protein [Escherichia coli]